MYIYIYIYIYIHIHVLHKRLETLRRQGIQEEEAKGNTAKVMVVGNKGAGALERPVASELQVCRYCM